MLLLEHVKVFIIEDNAGNLAVASLYLESQGASVKFERRGIDTAQAILNQMPVDVILTDLMLPRGVSGFDVFDQIRQHPQLANIPIIAVSAADPDTAMPLARQKGLAGFISKPITPQIVSYVSDVLHGKHVWIGDSGVMFS